MPHDETTIDMLRTDAALREREARIVELERELAQARAALGRLHTAVWQAGSRHDTGDLPAAMQAARDAVDRHAKD